MLGKDFSFTTVLLAAVAGSFMGIVIIIPLRKQLIEIERLKFPSGVAVATILKTPGAGMRKAVFLGVGFVIGATLTLLVHEKLAVIPGEIPVGPALKKVLAVGDRGALALGLLGTTLYVSTASLGAGMLSGRGGLAFAVGGVMAWWIVGPFVVSQGWVAPELSGGKMVGTVYATMLRPTGIGILIGGALGGVVAAAPAIKGAISSLAQAAKLAKAGKGEAEELSPKVLGGGLVASLIALFVVTFSSGEVTLATALVTAIVRRSLDRACRTDRRASDGRHGHLTPVRLGAHRRYADARAHGWQRRLGYHGWRGRVRRDQPVR